MSSRLGGAAAAACALALACAPTRRAGLEDATPLTTSGPPLDRGTSDTPQLLSGPPAPPRVYDVAVVGAGLAGLASARYLAVRGASVVVIEAQDAVAAGASSGARPHAQALVCLLSVLERRPMLVAFGSQVQVYFVFVFVFVFVCRALTASRNKVRMI